MQEEKSERRFSGEELISSEESLEVDPAFYQEPLNSAPSASSVSCDHRRKTRHSSLESEKNRLTRENSAYITTAELVTTTEKLPKALMRAQSDVAETSSMPQKKLIIVLAACFLVAGTIQTLSFKFTERISARDAYSEIAGNNAVDTSVNADTNIDGNHYVQSFYAVRFFFEFSFTHPFAQTFFMFTAESFCLVILLFQRIFQNKKTLALPHHPLVYAVPAASDFFASVIQNVGLFLTYASVYQMLRGAAAVWIAVLSRIVFHRHYAKIQKCGIATVVLGLTLVGMSSLIGKPSPTSQDASVQYPHQMYGNLLIICAQFLHGVQGVAEERLLQLYDIPPLQVIGIEGLFGLSLSIMLLAILQWYPRSVWGNNLSQLVVEEYGMSNVSSLSFSGANASFSTPLSLLQVTQWGSGSPELSGFISSLHVANNDTGSSNSTVNSAMTSAGLSHTTPNGGRGYFPPVPYDDINLVFEQMQNNSTCLLVVLLYIFSGLVYNVAQISIIKLLSAAATVLLGSLRNISVWLLCLILPFFHESFNVVQIIGFFFLILGNILFQRVLHSDFESFLPTAVIDACPILFKERHLVTFLSVDRRKAIQTNFYFSACSLTLGETVEAGRHWGLLPPLVSSSTTGLSKSSSFASSFSVDTSFSQISSLSKGVCSANADVFKGRQWQDRTSEHDWYHCSRVVLENPFSSDVRSSSFCAATGESSSEKGIPSSPSLSPMRSSSTLPFDCDRVASTLEDVCRKQAYLSSVSRMPSHSRVGMVSSHVNLMHIEGKVRAIFLGHRGGVGMDEMKNRVMMEAIRNAWDNSDQYEEADSTIQHKTMEESGESREGKREEDHDGLQVDHRAFSRRSLWETEHLLRCFSPGSSSSPSSTAAPSPSTPLSPLGSSTSFYSSSSPPLHLLIWLSVVDSLEECGVSEPLVVCCPLSPSMIQELEHEAKEGGFSATSTTTTSGSSSPLHHSPLHHYFSSQLLRKRVIVSGQLREQERYDGDVHRIVPIPYVLLPLDGFGRNIRVLESIFSKKV